MIILIGNWYSLKKASDQIDRERGGASSPLVNLLSILAKIITICGALSTRICGALQAAIEAFWFSKCAFQTRDSAELAAGAGELVTRIVFDQSPERAI